MTEPLTLTVEEVREIAYQAAGAATAPFMRDHPHYVMPVEQVREAVEAVLHDLCPAAEACPRCGRTDQAVLAVSPDSPDNRMCGNCYVELYTSPLVKEEGDG